MDPRFDSASDSIDDYLARHESKELLRFLTCGSVDDGKSTLIGRLLHDTKAIYEDQLAAVHSDSRKHGTQGETADLALLVDGLRSEREQGITIDVAYRYFSTDARKFIVADTPGHEQYTRNMATGASTCDLAVLLVDARHGVSVQTRRHAVITSLLGIPRIIVAINKMDLVDWSQEAYDSICEEFKRFASDLPDRDHWFIPMSALEGDYVADESDKAPYYDGPTFLKLLETIPIGHVEQAKPFRMPVQYVIRPDLDFRGFGGRIESGTIKPGDEVTVLPAGTTSRVQRISTFDGDLEIAGSPRSVALVLEDEIDASRGDVIACTESKPKIGKRMHVTTVWMHDEPLAPGREYLLRHGTRTTPCRVRRIRHRLDIETLEKHETPTLGLNEIGLLEIETDAPLVYDPYDEIRGTGAIILIDRIHHGTVAAGMIRGATRDERWTASPISGSKLQAGESLIDDSERSARLGQKPATVLLTGLAGSGKTSIAGGLERALFDLGRTAMVLDGQTMRLGLNRDLGFTALDRSENLRRSMEMAKIINDQGILCIAAFVAPQASVRAKAGELLGEDRFLVVHCAATLESCRESDPSGIYAEADKSGLKNIPGISFTYEEPENPDLRLASNEMSIEDCVSQIITMLQDRGILT
ncbi:MAG: sulfate adenylyltransferase subunit CysN [Phycisphaerales bacterium]|nr:sulfate adenylyltransferase subunit CysN [Phycisphaerales bacterium]